MGTAFPDDQSVATVLSLAARAPSVHNSQPWRWTVGEESLHLYADSSMQLSRTDPDRRELVISCGAALHHCVVGLAALDWGTRVHRFPDPAEPDHLASVEVYPAASTQLDFALAAAIPRRRTDRRIFSHWPVPRADVHTMAARVKDLGVEFRRVESVSTLNSIVHEAIARHSADDDYVSELRAWSGRQESVEGVPARNTPPADATTGSRIFASPALDQPAGAYPNEDAAVMVGLGTATDDPVDRLRAGEAASVVLLTATALGMASCPVSEPLEIDDTRELVRTELFGSDVHPQMLLRIGWAPINADPLPPTPRRPLSEVVARLDGSPFL